MKPSFGRAGLLLVVLAKAWRALIGLLAAASGVEPAALATLPPHAPKAKDVFDLSRLVIFSDDFS